MNGTGISCSVPRVWEDSSAIDVRKGSAGVEIGKLNISDSTIHLREVKTLV
jgi:hypothetical protein